MQWQLYFVRTYNISSGFFPSLCQSYIIPYPKKNNEFILQLGWPESLGIGKNDNHLGNDVFRLLRERYINKMLYRLLH